MIFVVSILVTFFVVLLIVEPKCPSCGGKMRDVNIHHGRIAYKCDKCGKEWI